MKKSTLLKLAMSFSLMLLVSGAFAQINLTIRDSNGALSASAVVYTINSSTGAVVTPVATAIAGVATWNPGNGYYNYLVRNAGTNQWNAYSVNYTGVIVNASITLSASFIVTPVGATDYVANRTADKVTNAKALPYWVFPSPVHNPTWAIPGTTYAAQGTIEQGAALLSTFGWTLTGGTGASTTNYVDVTPNASTSFAAITTAQLSLSVVETPAAAYGGCGGTAVNFYSTIINPPFAKITTGAAAVGSTIGGAGYWRIASGCESLPALTTNIAISFDNTQEEFPFYMRLIYNVYNPTILGTDITLGAPLAAASFPAGLRPQSAVVGGDANQTTNPMRFLVAGGYTPSIFAAPVTFTAVNNNITVYEFDLNSWNGKISRKADYLAWRTAGAAPAINSANYTWYTNAAIANTFDATAFIKKGYVIVYPKPVTGPIYHIANSWGL